MDVGLLLVNAELSQIAYSDYAIEHIKERGYCNVMQIMAQPDEHRMYDVQCYMFDDDNGDTTILFRGSESIQDWIVDFMAVPDMFCEETGIHLGFLSAYRSIEDELNTELTNRNVASVSCVGHSLGGALAQVTAHMIDHTFKVTSVFTYGSPRWCIRSATQRYEMDIANAIRYRVVNNMDCVPDVPPAAKGFKHPNDEVYIDRKGRLHRSPNRMWKRWDKFWGTPEQKITDHFMDNYILRLVNAHEIC